VRDGEESNSWWSAIERSEALRLDAVKSFRERWGLPGLCNSAQPREETCDPRPKESMS
jgi:hypothetical protein